MCVVDVFVFVDELDVVNPGLKVSFPLIRILGFRTGSQVVVV